MWWVAVAGAAPTCDRAAVEALTVELRSVPAPERPAVLASRWGALCEVDAWHDVAAEVAQVGDPVRRRLVELQLVVGRAHLLPELCADPTASLVFSQASKMTDADGRALVFRRCLLHRDGFFGEDEFVGAPGGAWLSLFAWAELKSGGIPPAVARPVVRAVAGLPP